MQKIPRPLGTTLLLQQLKGDNVDVNVKNRLVKEVINQWLANHYKLNNKPYSIQDICQYLDIDHTRCIREMGRFYGTVMGFKLDSLDENAMKALTRASQSVALGWGTEAMVQAQQQLQVMLQAQGGLYTPFVSAEVNSAMRNVFQAITTHQTVIANILKMEAQPKTKTIEARDITEHQTPQPNQEELVSRQELLKFLSDNFKADGKELGKLSEAELEISTENINGRFIKGIKADDFTKGVIKLPEAKKPDHHQERRLKELEMEPIEMEIEEVMG